jgi:predicted transcriptional regulator of viral defense system
VPGTTQQQLFDRAQDTFGFITTDDAREVGVDPARLRMMAARGFLEHRDRGIYRVRMIPETGLDPYMEAVAWTRHLGVLSHETALDLYELCDVNPTRIYLTVPRGFRTKKALPNGYLLHRRDLTEAETARFEGIPIVSPCVAIEGAIEQALGWDLIEEAIQTARAKGAITKESARWLRSQRPLTGDSDGT